MSFTKLGLGLVATTAIATATAVAPAQAAILDDGGFSLNGTTTATTDGSGNVTIDFSGFSLIPGSNFGAFSGISGTPTIASLPLQLGFSIPDPPLGPRSFFSNAAITDFISGLTLNGEALAFDLDAGFLTQSGTIENGSTFSIGGPITGVFRSGNTVVGQGTLGLNNSGIGGPISNISLTSRAIPTPALLPGLIGLGLGVVRKRKAAAIAEKV